MKKKPILLVCAIVFIFQIKMTTLRYNGETEPLKRNTVDISQASLSTRCSFIDAMKTIQWDSFRMAIKNGETTEIQRYTSTLIWKLVEFIVRPPAPYNKSCVPPPLKLPLSQTCVPLIKPRRVGMLWLLGFDVDALEIHLHELNAVVDKFFIIESVEAHNVYSRSKPLIWEMVKKDERFSNFTNKVVHFTVDDSNLAHEDVKQMWYKENQEVILRWRKFLEWNNATRFFGNDDLLGIGDVDEVTHRDNVYYMKQCKIPHEPVDIGIWFPMDGINTVFASDFPVPNHKYSFAEPTFWTFGNALSYYQRTGKPPNKLSGKGSGYLLGGMHLSKYSFPPFKMMKSLTLTSVKLQYVKNVVEVGAFYANNLSALAEFKLDELLEPSWKSRIMPLEQFRQTNKIEADAIVKFPWFLLCNRPRFPSFFGKHDIRLEAA